MKYIPDDVLMCIVDVVDPFVLPTLSITCKLLHELCSGRLAVHRDRERRYTKITMNKMLERSCHPALVLLRIQQEPEVIPYIKSLLTDHTGKFLVRGHPHERPQLREVAMSAIAQLDHQALMGHLPKAVRENFAPAITRGDVDETTMLLITLLPNLKHLRLGGELKTTISWNRAWWAPTKLEVVELYHNDTESFEVIEMLTSWATFPSVKILRGFMIDGVDLDDMHPILPAATSVHTLELTVSSDTIESLQTTLSRLPDLRSFSHSDTPEIADEDFDFLTLVDALQTYSPNLERLELHNEWGGHVIPARTLKGLSKLGHYEGNQRVLPHKETNGVFTLDFAELFPPSIETVARRFPKSGRWSASEGVKSWDTVVKITGLQTLPKLRVLTTQNIILTGETVESLTSLGVETIDDGPQLKYSHQAIWGPEPWIEHTAVEDIERVYGCM